MKNSNYTPGAESNIIKHEGVKFLLSFLTLLALFACFQFRDATIIIARSAPNDYIAALLPPVVLMFTLYGLYLTRFKASLISFVVFSAFINLLMCMLRIYMISKGTDAPHEPVIMAAAVHVASFALTFLIRFLFIKCTSKKGND